MKRSSSDHQTKPFYSTLAHLGGGRCMVEGLLGQMCLPDRVLPEDVSMPDQEGGVWRCFFRLT